MKETSIQAYLESLKNGLITKRRYQVAQLIGQMQPVSANNLVRHTRELGFQGNQTGLNARFSELEKQDVIEKCGEVVDSVSKKRNGIYRLTLREPVKLKKPKKIKCVHCNGKGFIEQGASEVGVMI